MPKNANVGFLRHSEAAGALAVEVRTIHRWLARQKTRDALGAVRRGQQWRIPLPENLYAWEYQTRARLMKLAICPPRPWERELQKLGKAYGRYRLESDRFWLAATLKAFERSSITEEDKDAILLLWQAACKVLDPLPRTEMDIDKLKSNVLIQLSALGLSEIRLGTVMSYWPEEKHLNKVRAARTFDALEAIWRNFDYTQAARDLEQESHKLTRENLRAFVHKDIMTHINDTRERLPGIVVRPEGPEKLNCIVEATTYLTVDFRRPQDGLKLRTFQRRFPRRKKPQRDILNLIQDVQDSLPGAEGRSRNGKTPLRGPY